jgi:hypothetical protein
MRARPFWDSTHPRSALYHRAVERGFAMLYPETKHDEFGRMADVPPLPPGAVARQVAAFNREMDRLEAMMAGASLVARTNDGEGGFDERPGGGTVHVQSHTRDGGKTEVTDHWRARPGQGGDRAEPGVRGGADDPEGVQAGPDNERSTPSNPHVARDVDSLVREWSGKWHGDGECVALFKKAIPGLGATPTWKEGEKLKGLGDPPMAPGTAIATFENGKYPNRSTGNHAAIVIEPGVVDGKEGYWVFDQSRNRRAQRRFYAFGNTSGVFTSRPENYSVIRKGP